MAIRPQIRQEDRDRLRALIDDRVLEMGMTLRAALAEADVRYETLRSIRERHTPTRLTMRRIDTAMRWVPGSTEHVLLKGGDPSPIPLEAITWLPPGSGEQRPESGDGNGNGAS